MASNSPFAIAFRAEMSSEQARWLSSELGLTFHAHPKLEIGFVAFAALDSGSGLYLIREQEDRWRLECRTYGHPSQAAIKSWELRARWVVGVIDPGLEPAGERAEVVG